MSDRRNSAADGSPLSQQLRAIRKLGVSDFEAAADIGRVQVDLRERLKSNAWFRRLHRRLERCSADSCGNERCVEVCAFGDWGRRLQLIPAAHQLISNSAGPVHEVKVVRGIWARQIGDLREVSIAAAKQLNRRALDSLYIPTLVAIGTFKVFVAPKHLDLYWLCEVHQIVAGANKKELEDAFTRAWAKEQYDSVVRVKQVRHLGQTVNDVLRADLRGWQHPDLPGVDRVEPTKAHREEFYRWLLSLSLRERMIRYGCDRYLNSLQKKPRTMRPKIHKPRPYPAWLIPHMFGNRSQPSEYPRRRDRRYG